MTTRMTTEQELIGVWELVDQTYLGADGATREGPLGPRAEGLLIYGEHGYMSVGLMRAAGAPTGGPGGVPVTFMGYSGRWWLADEAMVHEVVVASHARIVDTRQVRELRLEGDRLTLRERLDESPRYLVLNWRRR